MKGYKLQKYVYVGIAPPTIQTTEDIDGLYAAITERAREGEALCIRAAANTAGMT